MVTAADPSQLAATERGGTWVSSGGTHLGRVRKLNEDAFLDRGEVGLWVVADGMGGHSAGDFASSLIVDSLETLDPRAAGGEFADAVESTLKAVHDELMREAERRGPRTVIGSTVLALVLNGDQAIMLWAGDSRLYRLRGHGLVQLTRDHSLVQDLVDAGELTPEQAEHHPQSNVITRAVGAGETLEIDRRDERVSAGDVLLLCSDGLGRVVPADDIVATLRETPTEDAAAALIDKALAFGTTDNVTAVVVRVDSVTTPGAATEGEALIDDDATVRPGAIDDEDDDEPTLPSGRRPGAQNNVVKPKPSRRRSGARSRRPPAPRESTERGSAPAPVLDEATLDEAMLDEVTLDETMFGATMVGVPRSPPPAASTTPSPSGDGNAGREPGGRRTLFGWPAILVVVVVFLALLAGLYLL